MISEPRQGITRRAAMAGVAALGGALISRQTTAEERASYRIPTILTENWATYQPSGSAWWGLNDTWHIGSLRNGIDFTQTLTCYPLVFPNRTVIAWNFGSNIGPSNVWGYPEVVYGSQNGGVYPSPNRVTPAPIQLHRLSRFTMSWNMSLSGNLNYYDVLAETHLSSTLTGNDCEFGILLWSPPYLTSFWNTKTRYSINLGGFAGEVSPDCFPKGFAMMPTSVKNGTPWLSGTIDFLPIIEWGITQRLLNPTWYLLGFELGVEPQQGSGTLTMNSLNYDWDMKGV
jgi:hypothetical protein